MVRICGENMLKIDIFATNSINEFGLSANLKLGHCSNCHFRGEIISLANLTDLFSYVYFILTRRRLVVSSVNRYPTDNRIIS